MEPKEWRKKVEKYFSLLHPDFKTLSGEEQRRRLDDNAFIIDNIEAIEEAFTNYSNPKDYRFMRRATDQERMQQAMRHVKIEKYFAMLHPDFDSVPAGEKWKFQDDKQFIFENVEAIHKAFEMFSNYNSPRYMGDSSDQEKMQYTMKHVKIEKYFALLHPNYESLSVKEKWDSLGDKTFIIDNVEAIRKAYNDFGNPDSSKYMEDATAQEKMQKAMHYVKVEKYFGLLHPNFDTLTPQDQLALLEEKNFISENIDAIHEVFEDFSNSDSIRYMENASGQEKIKATMKKVQARLQGKTTITPQDALRSALSSEVDRESVDKARRTESLAMDDKTLEGETKND